MYDGMTIIVRAGTLTSDVSTWHPCTRPGGIVRDWLIALWHAGTWGQSHTDHLLVCANMFYAMAGVYVREVDSADFSVTQETVGVRITQGNELALCQMGPEGSPISCMSCLPSIRQARPWSAATCSGGSVNEAESSC